MVAASGVAIEDHYGFFPTNSYITDSNGALNIVSVGFTGLEDWYTKFYNFLKKNYNGWRSLHDDTIYINDTQRHTLLNDSVYHETIFEELVYLYEDGEDGNTADYYSSDGMYKVWAQVSGDSLIFYVYKMISAPQVNVKVEGSWKIGTPYVKVGGVWKEAEAVYVKVNDTWKQSV